MQWLSLALVFPLLCYFSQLSREWLQEKNSQQVESGKGCMWTVSFVCVCVYPPFSPIIQGLFGNIFVVPPSQFFMTFAPFFPFTPMTGNVHKHRQNHSEWKFSPKTLNRHAYTQTEHELKWKFKQTICTYCIKIQESALHNMYCVYVCILWDPTCSLSQWTQFDPPDSNIVFS